MERIKRFLGLTETSIGTQQPASQEDSTQSPLSAEIANSIALSKGGLAVYHHAEGWQVYRGNILIGWIADNGTFVPATDPY